MKRLFDPEPIKAQIANLLSDRNQIDRAIEALNAALQSVEGITAAQGELTIDARSAGITLHDAVKRACLNMRDGITRQRVILEIERGHPFLKPKSASVGASLINLAKGDHPMLNVAIEGRGRSPSYYSTDGNTVHRLSSDEINDLFDPQNTKGTGGWQSLFASLQRSFDKASGKISLSPEQRARIYYYYHDYGVGGWQDRIKRIFRREIQHLFAS
jgi:hypothetical protein